MIIRTVPQKAQSQWDASMNRMLGITAARQRLSVVGVSISRPFIHIPIHTYVQKVTVEVIDGTG